MKETIEALRDDMKAESDGRLTPGLGPWIEQIDAILAEYGWQSIEIAPKDGTPVLVWDPVNNRHGGWATRARYNSGEWVIGDLPGKEIFPTHWMPLPAGPKAEEE